MPRAFSSITIEVLNYLWFMPWACAADIARVSGLETNVISNVLKRRAKKGWLRSAKLGRVFDAVDRYVVDTAGVKELRARWGWQIFWWHTADGIRALARRLEVVEMAYYYLPSLWQSNLVVSPMCYVYCEREDTAWQTGQPVTRRRLVKADWSKGWLVNILWLKNGPFEAIAVYKDGRDDEIPLFLPILWRTDFQKPGDISSVRRDMDSILLRDRRWSSLPTAQSVSWDYVPGLIVFCPGRVAAAVLQRHWSESRTLETATMLAIIDAEGQVVRAMNPPAAWWEGLRHLPAPGDVDSLGDISKAVERLKTGAYAAVNGKRNWRQFRCVDGSPSVTIHQIAEASVGGDTTKARAIRDEMVRCKVLIVRADGHFLGESGRGLLASSQRRTGSRVKKRLGVYEKGGGEYRRDQRLHNQGQADLILYLRRHGYAAFPTMGLVIDYWYQGRLARVAPDAFVVLPPGVLVAIEYERSAESPKDLEDKAGKYWALYRIGKPIPVLFVTETEEAAKRLAALHCPYLLATTLDAVRQGPHGSTTVKDGRVMMEKPGCWWFENRGRGTLISNATIDLIAYLYVRSYPNGVWRLPTDQSFKEVQGL